MRTAFCFILLALLISRRQNVFGGRIINGEIVPDDTLQYMASLQTGSGEHLCGGFLISDQFVITAAHCEYGKPQSVVLGTNDLSNVDDTMRYRIRKCDASFKFALDSDIMLLKLSRPSPVKPVPLPEQPEKVFEEAQCRVAGWGSTKTDGPGATHLRTVNVSFINHEICSNKWSEADVKLPDGVICAGGYNTTKGFCQGDSGGPLICNGAAVGVVSFNYFNICNYPTFPNVYTSLTKFLPWITHAVSQNGCLKEKASLEEGVKIIQLPKEDMEVKAHDKCQVAGWKRVINVSIINKTFSQMNKNTWKNLPPNVIYAKGETKHTGLLEMDHQQLFTAFLFLSCLQQTVTGSVIVNGKKVADGDMPYMASVQSLCGHVCGGFLVSQRFVLTAAHCLDENPIRVVLGNHDLGKSSNSEQTIEIEAKIKHPDYVSVGRGDDLMLLKLKKEVVIGSNVGIIQLPYTNMKVETNEMCHVAGWGATQSYGKNTNHLLTTDVSIIDMDTCQRKWRDWLNLPKDVICAGGYTTRKGFCQGDSGGPLVCANTAVGIVSFNKDRNCDYRDQVPNVYVEISQYIDWIFHTMISN
ncbi:transmembrane protease serine 9-like [Eucyclogobius newberryi]|uniref:transmembrane protease serine 9-like n=1 Tax=Eucyclogobius newberryi TaxID=166745 RepID=UPI003B5947A4